MSTLNYYNAGLTLGQQRLQHQNLETEDMKWN